MPCFWVQHGGSDGVWLGYKVHHCFILACSLSLFALRVDIQAANREAQWQRTEIFSQEPCEWILEGNLLAQQVLQQIEYNLKCQWYMGSYGQSLPGSHRWITEKVITRLEQSFPIFFVRNVLSPGEKHLLVGYQPLSETHLMTSLQITM